MIRRTMLKLAAAAMIHPAFNWTGSSLVDEYHQPTFRGIPIAWVPKLSDDTTTIWFDTSFNFLCQERRDLPA